MKLNKKIIIGLAIALVLLLLIGIGIRNMLLRNNEAGQPPSDMLVQVERGELEIWVTGNGTVVTALEETVRTRMTGTIETYLLEEGQEVVAGARLVTLKYQDLSLQIEKAELEIARLEHELSNLNAEQISSTVQALEDGTITWLFREGDWVQQRTPIAYILLGSNNDEAEETVVNVEVRAPITGTLTELMVQTGAVITIGQALAEMKNQERAAEINQQIPSKKLQIKQARLELTELKQKQRDNRENSVIYAPIDGTVVLPEMNAAGVGMDVIQGTVLATIVDYSKLEVIVPIDELDINRVQTGQKVNITVDSVPDRTITGEVIRIASRGKVQGGVATFDVTIAITAPKDLKAGMNAGAAILVDLRSNTLLVPIEAVFEQEGETMVMVVADDEEAGKSGPYPIKVVTGVHDTSFIEILAGVQEGTQIMIQGSPAGLNLRGGMFDGFRPQGGESP